VMGPAGLRALRRLQALCRGLSRRRGRPWPVPGHPQGLHGHRPSPSSSWPARDSARTGAIRTLATGPDREVVERGWVAAL
jgi:hypothetical protein